MDISGNAFNMVDSRLLRPGLSMCVHFVFKLQLLCQARDINKLISFGASFQKDAKRTISFQEETCYLFFPACLLSVSPFGATAAGLFLASSQLLQCQGTARSASLSSLEEWKINAFTSLPGKVHSRLSTAVHRPSSAFGYLQTTLQLSGGFEQLWCL